MTLAVEQDIKHQLLTVLNSTTDNGTVVKLLTHEKMTMIQNCAPNFDKVVKKLTQS